MTHWGGNNSQNRIMVAIPSYFIISCSEDLSPSSSASPKPLILKSLTNFLPLLDFSHILAFSCGKEGSSPYLTPYTPHPHTHIFFSRSTLVIRCIIAPSSCFSLNFGSKRRLKFPSNHHHPPPFVMRPPVITWFDVFGIAQCSYFNKAFVSTRKLQQLTN